MTDLQYYAFLFLIWLISTVVLRILFSKHRSRPHLPPGPLSLPIIGHLHLMGPIPHQAFHKLSTRYGPLIHLYLGSVLCVLASNATFAKEFLKNHEMSFASRPISSAVHHLSYGSADFSFAPYGLYWKFMKKLCMTELLGGRILDQFLPIRQEEIRRLVVSLSEKGAQSQSMDIRGEFLRFTNNVICRMIMSERCSEKEGEEEVRKLVLEVVELTGIFNLSDFIGFCKNLDLQGLKKRFVDVGRRFDVMMERILREHEEARREKKFEGGVKDVLHILLDIMEDENAEMKLTRENIKAFVVDIFSAGTDTSAITTEWALAELINHPTMFERAREEIDSVVGKARLVEESDIANLPYLQAIVKETLRLHPTGPLILRESTEDCMIGGYFIPAKTTLFVNVWAIGRDPDHWENPLEFRPERFMTETNIDVRGQHFHLLPFGSGRRGCPGTSLALQLVQTTLAAMIQCFDWKVGNGEENAKVDMAEGIGLTLPRAKPLVCVPVARLDPLPLM